MSATSDGGVILTLSTRSAQSCNQTVIGSMFQLAVAAGYVPFCSSSRAK